METAQGGMMRWPAPRLAPEMALLLACLVWPRTEAALARVAARAADVNWERFLSLAARHRVFPLAAQGLRAAGVMMPAETSAALEHSAARIGLLELSQAAELARLLDGFAAAGLRPIVLKGVPLSLRAFGTLGLRHCRDIDLLVSPAKLTACCSVLEACGYARREPPPGTPDAALRRYCRHRKDMVFHHRQLSHIVELHWRLFDNSCLLPLTGDESCGKVPISPRCAASILPEMLELLFLCVHGAEHGWSRLKWLADLSALLAPLEDAAMLRLYEAGRAARVGRAAALALMLCGNLLGLPIPRKIIADFNADWRLRVLYSLACRVSLGGGDTEIEASATVTTVKNLSHYLLSDGWRFWLREASFDLADMSADTDIMPSWMPAPLARPFGWVRRHIFRRALDKN